MKQQLNATRLVLILALVAATIGITAFQQKDSARKKAFREGYSQGDVDTTTRRKRDRTKDEFNMDVLELQMKKLDEQMIELDLQMKNMDFSKVEKDVNDAMKKIDFEQIGKEVELAMKKVDWDKIQSDVNKSVSEAKKVDVEKIKKEMQKVKIELEKEKMNFHFDGEKIRKEVEAEMEKAKENLAEAKEEMKNIQLLTNALGKDGLIDKSKAYKIELKEGELYINGTRQSKEISDKYRQFYKKGNFTIKNNPDAKEGASI